MPYFEVTHNGVFLARAGAPDISVITAHVTVTVEGGASLGIHGMRSTESKREHFNWVSQNLRPGDQVEIVYLAEGGEATPPRSTSARDITNIEEELQRIQGELREFEAKASKQPAPKPRSWTRAPRPRLLKISTNQTSALDASLGDEQHLQAVLNFTSLGCVLEVDALTVLEDGDTKGKRWLRENLESGDYVRIALSGRGDR